MSDHAEGVEGAGPLAELDRWEAAGGVWRVLHGSADQVVVSLCTCDGGEEVSRLTSTDPAVVAALARREPPAS